MTRRSSSEVNRAESTNRPGNRSVDSTRPRRSTIWTTATPSWSPPVTASRCPSDVQCMKLIHPPRSTWKPSGPPSTSYTGRTGSVPKNWSSEMAATSSLSGLGASPTGSLDDPSCTPNAVAAAASASLPSVRSRCQVAMSHTAMLPSPLVASRWRPSGVNAAAPYLNPAAGSVATSEVASRPTRQMIAVPPKVPVAMRVPSGEKATPPKPARVSSAVSVIISPPPPSNSAQSLVVPSLLAVASTAESGLHATGPTQDLCPGSAICC